MFMYSNAPVLLLVESTEVSPWFQTFSSVSPSEGAGPVEKLAHFYLWSAGA